MIIFAYKLSTMPIIHKYQLIKELAPLSQMKKIRISKKNPNKILRTLQVDLQIKHISNPLDSNTALSSRQDIRDSISSKKGSFEMKKAIQSNRYKSSSPQQPSNKNQNSYSMNKQKIIFSSNRQNLKYSIDASTKNRAVIEKSPYLYSSRYDKSSQRFLGVSPRRSQQDSSFSRQKKHSLRLKSLKRRSNSEQISNEPQEQMELKQAKRLIYEGQNNKSIFILKRILKSQPQNIDVHFLLCLNFYNLGDFMRTIKLGEQALERSQFAQLYLLVARSYAHIGDQNNYLKKLNEYENRFPDDEEVYLQKQKYYESKKDQKKLRENLQHALKINPLNLHTIEKMMSVCVDSQIGEIMKILKRIKSKVEAKKLEKINELQCQILCKQQKYKELIQTFRNSSSLNILFYVAYSYYMREQHQKASLVLESCLIESGQPLKYIKLLIAVKIHQRNFYDAMHLLERVKHLSIRPQQIELETCFINGVIYLIRRDIPEGVNLLNRVMEKMPSEIHKEQSFIQISQIIHSFLAYGYYCLGKYQKCQNQYELQNNKFPQVVIEFAEYNRKMNQAVWLCSCSKQEQALRLFIQASEINPNRLQPYLCLALSYFKMGYKKCAPQMIEQARVNFDASLQHTTKIHNNSSSYIYFYKCIFHAYLQEWRDAIICIDQAIERAQENYWKHFYVRSLIFASLHNFSEALNDVSIAINLKKNKPQLYHLRASCFQIEGDGTNAFQDLQTYIALRPDDPKIHKFAGKLLFQNGAFEDAIKAFSHDTVEPTLQNFDVFLTKAKTYFLLGFFEEAAQQLKKLLLICPEKIYLEFDAQMMLILCIISQSEANKKEIIQRLEDHYHKNFTPSEKNYIFKETQLHSFKGICLFQLNLVEEAIKQFEMAIKAKQKIIVRETLIEGNNREDERDTRIYLSQMKFNICICYLKLGEIDKAREYAQKMQINRNDAFHSSYQKFRHLFNENQNILEREAEIKKIEIFPNRNKISHYLSDFSFQIHSKTYYSRLCIPFPKVQPPEIFPIFDPLIFQQLSATKVQKKPEAPWIFREQNSINFTGKIERYSRLQLEQEESIPDTNSVSQFYPDTSHISLQSLSSRKVQISINEKIEDFRNGKKNRRV